MRAMLLLLFGLLFFFPDVFAEEKPAVTEAEVQAAEAKFTLMKSNGWEGPQLEQVFMPATRARVDFWEDWLQEKKKENKDNAELSRYLERITATYVVSLGEKSSQCIPFYADPDGTPIVHGKVRTYSDHELLTEESFQHGQLDGECIYYYSVDRQSIAKPNVIITFRQGIMDGPLMKYYENGKPKLKGQFKDGMADGEFTGFNSEGREIGKFKMKAGAGTYMEWNKWGDVDFKSDYEGGLPAGVEEHFRIGICQEKSHHKYLTDSKVSLPDGHWQAWATLGKWEQRVDLEFQMGFPINGRVWARLGGKQERAKWLYFKAGKIFLDPKDPGSALGEYKGPLCVVTDIECEGQVEIRGSKIYNGYFMDVDFKNSQALGRKLLDLSKQLGHEYSLAISDHYPVLPTKAP